VLSVLYEVESQLPALLQAKGDWNSVDINYHPPFVDRLWRQWKQYRIYLHRIYPCEPEQALFHPHPWPSAMHILKGNYEMAIGYGKGETTPPIAARIVTSSPFRYEMIDPDAWHYVRPIGVPAWTVMVTGTPWNREAPRSEKKLELLNGYKIDEMLAKFVDFYSQGVLHD
jgi:hypothetical protein